MLATRRRTGPAEPSTATEKAAEAAVSAPARRKGRKNAAVQAFLTTFDAAPKHLQDNPFILRHYRAGYDLRTAFRSALRLHNETGNIWTHLIGTNVLTSWCVNPRRRPIAPLSGRILTTPTHSPPPLMPGFIIFACLTAATISLRPAPLRLGADALAAVEQRLFEYGKTNLYDLIASAEAWERTVVHSGAEKVDALEDRLRSIGRHNLEELAALGDSARGVGRTIRDLGASGIAELAHMEERLSNFSAEAVADVEAGVHRAVAVLLDARWPVSRWPMHVFTAGAMICLLTSSVCHVLGCCSIHVSRVIWRFDYAGIAVLIVASFFPPIYYGFLCQPGLALAYLVISMLLGVSTLAVSLAERFQSPTLQTFRAVVFVALGAFGVVPVTHGWFIHGNVPEFTSAVVRILIMGGIYVLGAVIYAAQVPERWRPGAFDIAFHSHQIFHVAVVIAALIHYKTSTDLMHWRDAIGGCLSPAAPPASGGNATW